MYLRPSHSAVPRGLDKCLGWGCLTQAEQFGIIFSIVVTSAILILAYMYYLGRITEAHRELVVIMQRRRRRRRRSHNSQPSPALALTQVPVTQRVPTYPSGAFYQPMVYNVAGVIGPQPHQPIIPTYFPQQPIPVAYPVPPQQPQPSYRTRGHIPRAYSQRSPARTQSDSSSCRDLPPRQPSWRQRLARVLGLPVGRASTIASSSAPATLRVSHSQTRMASVDGTRAATEVRHDAERTSHESHTQAARVQVSESPPHQHEAPSEENVGGSSVPSDAATVHSDDYLPALINPPISNRVTNSAPSPRPAATPLQNRALDHNDSVDSDIYSGEEYSLPSVSSMRSEYSPDLRPTSPAMVKMQASPGAGQTGGAGIVSTDHPNAL